MQRLSVATALALVSALGCSLDREGNGLAPTDTDAGPGADAGLAIDGARPDAGPPVDEDAGPPTPSVVKGASGMFSLISIE